MLSGPDFEHQKEWDFKVTDGKIQANGLRLEFHRNGKPKALEPTLTDVGIKN